MTTQTIQTVEPTNVVRLNDRRPAMPADTSVGTIRLPDAPPVEQAPDADGRPSGWARTLEVGGRAWGHTTSAARLTALGVGTTVSRVWEYETAGEVTDQIRSLRAVRRSADPERRRELDEEIVRLRERRHQVAHARHREHATLAGAGFGGAAVLALIVATVMVGLVVPAVSAGITGGAAYLAGRREQKRRDSTVQLGAAGAGPTAQAPTTEAETTPVNEHPEHPERVAHGQGEEAPAASPQQAISYDRIIDALRDIQFISKQQTIKPIGIPTPDRRGNLTIEFTLPAGAICENLQRIAKAKAFAGALGLSLDRIDIQGGEAEGDVRLWIAAETPFSRQAPPSPLATTDRWSIWDGVPFGTTRKGERKSLQLLWSSMLFGGAQGYGKTTAMRLPAAAAVLDPHCRVLFADFKGGADWEELEQVAHRAIIGADPRSVDDFVALVDELIDEMDRRFAALRAMPKVRRPEMKLTPQIAAEDDMPVLFLLIDEIQEAFGALQARIADRELQIPSGAQQFKTLVEKLARLIRRGRACGLIVIAAGQRPDANSVPTAFRDVILKRYSVHTVDDTSSDMILGDGAAGRGLTAAGLGRHGVGVLAEEAGGEKIQPDWITPADLERICARGRKLRLDAGTLTGDAAGQQREVGGLLGLIVEAFGDAGDPDYLTTTDLVAALARLAPEVWAEVAAGDPRQAGTRLGKAVALDLDGSGRSLARVERSWGKGYLLADVQAAAGIAPK